MSTTHCPTCASELNICPRCGEAFGGETEHWNAPSARARVAAQSAKLVNIYGIVIQILGILAGLTSIFLSVWEYQDFLGGVWQAILAGIAAGALVAFLFAVQGAVWRMAANYVLVKVSGELDR